LILGCTAAPPAARSHVVEMSNFTYAPAQLEVAVGDTVVWVNRDIVPHTASDSLDRWNSGDMQRGARWSWVATGPGAYRYVCEYHPTMRGTVEVTGPANTEETEAEDDGR
jgi:plastocyanin